MGRRDTLPYGSTREGASPPGRRAADVEASGEAPHGSPPGDATAWLVRPAPLLSELEERRGWRPPPASHGLAFAGASLVLIGGAIAGTVFFLTPEQPRSPRPASPEPATLTIEEASSRPSLDGPDASADATDAGAAPKDRARRASGSRAPAPAPRAPARESAGATKDRASTGALPDLDRAAPATGDPFDTPSGLGGTAASQAAPGTVPRTWATPLPGGAPGAKDDRNAPPPAR